MNQVQHIDSEGQLHTCKHKVGGWVGLTFAENVDKAGKIVSVEWNIAADDWTIGVEFRFYDGPKVLYFTGTPLHRIRWKKMNGRSVWEWA
jgi:hypothetical protein